jgi:hypothetical protein
MTPAPNGNGRNGRPIMSRLLTAIQEMTWQTALIIVLLAGVTAPVYVVWKFVTDQSFRHDFMSSYELVQANVPCAVLIASTAQTADRYQIAAAYDARDRIERIIMHRSPAVLLTDAEIQRVCDEVQKDAQLMRNAKAQQLRDEQEMRGLLKP